MPTYVSVGQRGTPSNPLVLREVRSISISKKPSRATLWKGKLATTTAASLKRTTCCKSLRCFYHVNYEYYMECAKRLITSTPKSRRNILKTYLGSDKKFRFDGRHVCVTFLKEGFHFSTVMIAEVGSGEVKRQPVSRSSNSTLMRSTLSDINTSTTLESTTMESQEEKTIKYKKEAIVSFVERIAEDCGDSMPHRPDIHLPFHQIQEVFPPFDREFRKLYPDAVPVTKSYFRRMWLLHCPHVKVTKSTRFSICETCDTLRSQLRNKVVKGESTEAIKARRSSHLSFISRERMEYQKKRDRTRLHGNDFCSLIIDGADQSAFGLPHFTSTPKSQRGHALKVKLVGLLEHRLSNKLTLLTMTQEHQTGANHVIEVLHRFLSRKRREGNLPRKLFVQLDNCSRENKNKYVMAYLELLVANSVFDRIECGFLPVGHTHEDVDQAFSTTSSRLRVTNAITLSDLHSVLRTTYGGNVHVEHMNLVANEIGLCDKKKCLKRIDKITQWRYFLFVSENGTGPSTSRTPQPRSTTCYVKKNCEDEWQHLYPKSSSAFRAGVLTTCPDISETPPLHISCPDGLEEVNKRLWSEDERINNADKTIELHELRDFVFRNRVDPFHWDMNVAIENEYMHTEKSGGSKTDKAEGQVGDSDEIRNEAYEHCEVSNHVQLDGAHGNVHTDPPTIAPQNVNRIINTSTSDVPNNIFDYQVGSFVLVRCGDEDENEIESRAFWVAEVIEVIKEGASNYATHLKVHWFDHDNKTNGARDAFSAKYHPCYRCPKKKNQKQGAITKAARRDLQLPHYDQIHTDTVLVSFAGLTRNSTIPLSTQKKLAN